MSTLKTFIKKFKKIEFKMTKNLTDPTMNVSNKFNTDLGK